MLTEKKKQKQKENKTSLSLEGRIPPQIERVTEYSLNMRYMKDNNNNKKLVDIYYYSKTMKKPSLFQIIIIALSIPTTTGRTVGNLRVREGSPFKIAIFADLHFGEDTWTDWGPGQDVNSVNVMSAVLDAETPGHQSSCHTDKLPYNNFLPLSLILI